MKEIKWAEPPLDGRRCGADGKRTHSYTHYFVNEVRNNPGVWAYYGKKAEGSAYHLHRNYGLEVRMIGPHRGVVDIYARWRGND